MTTRGPARKTSRMRLSSAFAPTLKEVPADAELPSHVYMVRGGFIRRLAAGIYNFLPFGWRVIHKIEKIVRAERLEIMGPQGEPAAILGFDDEGAAGLFINDPGGSMRVALAHDLSGSALFIRDAEGVIRVGVAQFAHGGGGVALHGPGSRGAAVLYLKDSGSLTFYDLEGNPTLSVPEKVPE